MNTSPHTKHHLSLRKLRHHPLARIAFTLSAMAILWFFIKIPPADTFHTFLSSKEPVIFSRQCHDDPMHVLCQAIDSAQNSVFLRIYNLTSPELLMSLTSQAKKKHDVTLHYESMHAVKDFPISEEVTLQEHPVQGRKLMHKKALAIDHKYAWLGSANYTHLVVT